MLLPLQGFTATERDGREGSVEWRQVGKLEIGSKPVDMVPSPDGKHLYVLTAENTILVYNHLAQLQGTIPVGEGVHALNIARNGQFLFLVDEKEQFISILSVGFIVDIETEGAPFKGKADAPVTIAVYADFQ